MKTAKGVGIVTFAFGTARTLCPNYCIAHIAALKAWEFGAPIYTQKDVPIAPGFEVEYAGGEPGNPPSTLRMAQGAAQWAIRRRMQVIWVVAATPHAWFCERALKETVREAGMHTRIEIYVCDEIKKYPPNIWFSPTNTPKHTQSQKNWNRYERILKYMPFVVYKYVAF